METDIQTIGSVAGGFFAGVILPMAYRWWNDRNSEIIDVRTLKKLGLPRDDPDYSHIFTISNPNKRMAKAETLLEDVKERQDQCVVSMEVEQDKMDDLVRDMNRIQQRIRDADTIAEEDAVFLAQLSVNIQKQGTVLDNIAAELTGYRSVNARVRFFKQVKKGLDRKETINACLERMELVTELVTKMQAALTNGAKTMTVAGSQHDKMVERYVDHK